jgi:catechol 2,3-dioxygenase-like lactoylglutathione lyase family enzyme
MKLDHVTAIVPDAEVAADVLQRLLGAAPIASLSLPGMVIRSFKIGDSDLHVNAPSGPGPVDDHFRRHGAGYHHLAIRVDDMTTTLADLATRGFTTLGAPIETGPGLHEVFLDPATTGGMLIQLVERKAATSESDALDHAAVVRLAGQGERG